MLFLFGIIAAILTLAMFHSRNMMLGFPCFIFWALLGGYSYTLSTATWDIYYLLFFASLLGMAPFSAFAAYGLRTKKEDLADGDEFIDEGKDDLKFIDEGGKSSESGQEQVPETESRYALSVRDRANKRRAGIKRKANYGEFR
jgi:hypothetical protein